MGLYAYKLNESVEPSGSQSQTSGVMWEEECFHTVLWLVGAMAIQILMIR